MRISELVERSGVPLPTVKYYLREGLLPPGTPTGRNQAAYDEGHLQRLRMIRALIEIGGLPVSGVRDVLRAVDDPGQMGHDLRGIAHCTVARPVRGDRTSPSWQAARVTAAALAAERGWHVHPEAPAFDQLADAIEALRGLGQDDLLTLLPLYADTADELAKPEVAMVTRRPDRAGMVEAVVTGTVLGEAVFNALRRLAQEHQSSLLA
jgi:DNA-binding transcriptional MerR regulator